MTIKIKKIERQSHKEDNRIYLSDGSYINFEYSAFGKSNSIDAEIKVFDTDWNITHHIYIVRNTDYKEEGFSLKDLMNDNTEKKFYKATFEQVYKPNKDFIFRRVVDFLYN